METLNVLFRVPPETKSALQAAGLPMPSHIESCPLMTGDVIAYPAPYLIAMKVIQRVYQPASQTAAGCWHLILEKVPHPLE